MYYKCPTDNVELETYYPNFVSRVVGRELIEYIPYVCPKCKTIYGKEVGRHVFKKLQVDEGEG